MASLPNNHLLVFRFSSLGDVAMTVPVIRQLIDQYPDLSVTFVSDEKFKPLFEGIPHLDFFGADIRGKYKGITGLYRLYRQIKKEKKFNAIADLHNVLRTKVLSLFFWLAGFKIRTIDKGRAEKRALTRKQNKRLVQLPSGFQRYANVFEKLSYPITVSETTRRIKLPMTENMQQVFANGFTQKIGMAPFAKYKEKTYPPEEMEKLIASLSKKDLSIFLFGGGTDEIDQLERWSKKYPATINMAGKLSLHDELVMISHLDLMISMDSANMHLASLYGVPVVSIWGATHYYAGFYGFGQEIDNIVQADLYCRPCSVFGNKKCYRGDWACMKMITMQQIIDKAEKVLKISGEQSQASAVLSR